MRSAGLWGSTPSSWASRCGSAMGSSDSRARATRRVVALAEQLVQRAALEVAGEQARKPRLGQEDLLEQQRLAVGHPEPLEVDHRGADARCPAPRRRRRPRRRSAR